MNSLSFGERLALIRKRKGLSQQELSELTSIHQTNISKYENDETEPTVEKLKNISNALNVSLDFLVLGNEHSTLDPELNNMFEIANTLDLPSKTTLKSLISTFLNSQNK